MCLSSSSHRHSLRPVATTPLNYFISKHTPCQVIKLHLIKCNTAFDSGFLHGCVTDLLVPRLYMSELFCISITTDGRNSSCNHGELIKQIKLIHMRSEKRGSQFIEERKTEKRNKNCVIFHLPYVYDHLVKTLYTLYKKQNKSSLCLNPLQNFQHQFLFHESFMYPRKSLSDHKILTLKTDVAKTP